jgi:hypothetical protein
VSLVAVTELVALLIVFAAEFAILPIELAAFPIVLVVRLAMLLVFTFTLVEPHDTAKAVKTPMHAA